MANSIKPQYQICHAQQRSFLHCWSLRFFAVSTRCLDCTTLFCRVSACGSNRRRPDGQPAHQIGRSFHEHRLPRWPRSMKPNWPPFEAGNSWKSWSNFTSSRGRCIHQRMTRVLTVRIAPGLLAKAEARATQLGLDRAGYLRNLIERDLENAGAARKRRFASEDLVGRFRLGGQSANNRRVRETLKTRSRRETHR